MRLIYERSVPGRRAVRLPPLAVPPRDPLDPSLLRDRPAALPELTELDVVRHYTNLSRKNFSVDTQFYPLGSCTMKYNPKACEAAARHERFARLHPLWPRLPGGARRVQGALRLLAETERLLCELTGMAAFTLQPLAGAHGEWTGAMLMAAYHRDRGRRKTHLLIPDSAHGTNPASAALAGFEVQSVPSTARGTVDLEALRRLITPQTAGMMLTNPNTLGLFEPDVRRIADLVHAVDGLMYYDGANFNAILGRCKPAAMGFDVCHLNPHKTFAAPHGGGGPGAGPVGVVERLRPYLPVPRIARSADGSYALDDAHPKSIGPVAPFYGNFGVLARAYAYLLLLGRDGPREVSGRAVLNANYLLSRLRDEFPAVAGRCMHECVLSAKPFVAGSVRAMDFAKGLIDHGIHPPTVYFPLIVPEALMVEPTETESRETLDRFVAVLRGLARTARENPGALKAAPVTTPVGRLDEVAAARAMDLALAERE